MHCDESVLELVKRLCLSIYNETASSAALPFNQRRTTSLAYEILLKKSDHPIEFSDDDACNPLHELQFLRFELNILAKTRTDKKRSKRFDQCVDKIETEDLLNSKLMQALLTLLVSLKDSVQAQEGINCTGIGFENFFQSAVDDYQPYRIVPTEMMQLPSSVTNIFDAKRNSEQSRNPYMPSFMSGEGHTATKFEFLKFLSSNLQDLDNSRPSKYRQESYAPDNIFSSLLIKKAVMQPSSRLPNLMKLHQKQKPSTLPKSVGIHLQNVHEKPIFIKSLSWDHLGKPADSTQKEQKFASDCPSAFLHMLAVQAVHNNNNFDVNIIQTSQLITDIKLLLIGTPSHTFQYNEELMCFSMVKNVTVENVAPITTLASVQGFLECGTCYARLQILSCCTDTDYFNMKFDGFVFEALCSSVQMYLKHFNEIVISFEDKTVLQLSRRMDIMMRQVRMLAKVLAIHPSVYGTKEFPRGSEFLGYLYKEIAEVSLQEITILLVFILEQCCRVYFQYFEFWIFHGCIEDPCKELFIEFIDHYRPNTKYFWDKAYLVKRHSVPGFLQGFEDTTLLCGKYTMLLKAYKPEHPLLSIQPPTIDVCLSAEQVQIVQLQCADYSRRAQIVCGDPISVCSVFKQKAAKKEAFMRQVAERFQENLAKWKLEQTASRQARQELYAKDRVILQQQIAEAREKKIQNRREQLAMEREYLRLEQKSEDARLIQEGIQRQKNIDYYTELGEIVDAQRERAESKMSHLRKQPVESLSTDTLEMASKSSLESEYESARDYEQNVNVVEQLKVCENDGEDIYHSTESLTDYPAADDLAVQNENYKSELQTTDLKKSASDYFNSNDVLQITTATDAKRNKIKVLGSAFDFSNYDQTSSSTTTIITESINQNETDKLIPVSVDKDTNYNVLPVISERQRNKEKVLGQEYDIICPIINVVLPVDNNVVAIEMSDLQRNRQKVMHDEFCHVPSVVKKTLDEDCEFFKNKNQAINHQHDFANQNVGTEKNKFVSLTDLQKNRQRAMHDDFGTRSSVLKQSMSLDFDGSTTLRTFEVGTPMSTGSDTPVLSERIDEDIENANVENSMAKGSPRKFGNLKLQTNLPKSCAIPSTANLANPTPDSGLNTAGLLAKDGFVFDISESKTPLPPIRTTYERSSDMISSNFTTETNIDGRERTIHLSFKQRSATENDKEKKHDAYLLKLDETRNLNITTITHFLRMSFVIPMQAHLNILNNEILKIYLVDLDILSHFKSLRNYFFMMDGEFSSHICDGIIEKLETQTLPADLLNFNVLHLLLDSALVSSIIGNDRNAEHLSFIVDELPEVFDLKSPNALQSLSLTYAVEWPLNLLLNSETITHYAKIFQYLLKLRRIRWVLDKTFEMLKETAKQSNRKRLRSAQFDHVQQIRNKLLGFINALQNHITSNALQASWRRFKHELETVKSMEDLYQKHTNYMKRVEFLCMLNKSSHEFYIKLEDVFIIVLRFYHKLKARNWRRTTSGTDFTHPNFQKLLVIEEDFQKLIKYIIHAGSKMSRRGYQTEIGEFIRVVNFNGYYDDVK